MSSDRAVDKIPAIKPRPVEMQVLCLGLSRTATMTMYTAVNKLGYRSYHFTESVQPQNIKLGHVKCWAEALRYKVLGKGEPYGPADFDKILQEYSAVTDMPCANFAKELVEAFPNAKVILTQRDPESWVKSVETSFYTILSWRLWPFMKWLSPEGWPYVEETLQLGLADWTAPNDWRDRKALAKYMPTHVAHVRSLVKPENLLEFHPRDGWEPLCRFLGKEPPAGNEPFPYVNKGDNAANIFRVAVAFSLVKILGPYLLVTVVAVVAWRWAVRV